MSARDERPPDVKPAARAGAAGDRAKARDDTATIRTGRKPFQGKTGTARNASQRPPRWSPPKGADALTELERLFAPQPAWCVTITKASSGAVVVFSTASCESDAEAQAARLRSFGLDASVRLTSAESAAPGSTIRGASTR